MLIKQIQSETKEISKKLIKIEKNTSIPKQKILLHPNPKQKILLHPNPKQKIQIQKLLQIKKLTIKRKKQNSFI